MIVDLAVYTDGKRRPCGDLSDELAMLRASGDSGSFLWVGLKDPTLAEFGEVDEELGLHPLAVEDAVNGRQRPKVEVYDDMVFVVLKPLRYVEETSDIETGELMLFLGANYLVTVRRGEVGGLHGLRQRLEADPESLAHGPAAVLHAVVDEVVDVYRAIDREIAADLETIEAGVFSDDPVDTGAIYRLKREVLEFRRAAQPLLTPLQQLHTSERSPVPDGELRLLVRDVSDHLHGVIDHIEGYDRLLTDVLGAHLAQLSVRQNNDMRKISAWVAIAAVPTMVAGVYGMNFDNMPELRWRYGYFVVLAAMATACVAIYRAFKRSGWL
ncbi:MAG: magnesium/cobalt transporter CorA [Dermatophilaceae bacterium]